LTIDKNIRLGSAIREKRRERGFTQFDLSEKAGLDRSHLSLIESGEHHPTKRTVEKIALALDCTPEELQWTGDYLAGLSQISYRKIYPGLRELLNDADALTLYKITEEEKLALLSIRLQWNNPSKQFFIQALLDYRRSRNKRE
jgi:transcriptional regulator with XRE-family HTH domain